MDVDLVDPKSNGHRIALNSNQSPVPWTAGAWMGLCFIMGFNPSIPINICSGSYHPMIHDPVTSHLLDGYETPGSSNRYPIE